MSEYVDPVSSSPRRFSPPPPAPKKKLPTWAIIILVVVGISILGTIIEKFEEPKESYNWASVESSDSKPVAKKANYNIQVTSTGIKQVNGKYRYFFDIRNKGSEAFEGSVRVELDRADASFGVGDEFDSESHLDPSSGIARYVEVKTAPTFIDSEYGVDRFTWEAVQGYDIVQSGNGTLTTKYDAYE